MSITLAHSKSIKLLDLKHGLEQKILSEDLSTVQIKSMNDFNKMFIPLGRKKVAESTKKSKNVEIPAMDDVRMSNEVNFVREDDAEDIYDDDFEEISSVYMDDDVDDNEYDINEYDDIEENSNYYDDLDSEPKHVKPIKNKKQKSSSIFRNYLTKPFKKADYQLYNDVLSKMRKHNNLSKFTSDKNKKKRRFRNGSSKIRNISKIPDKFNLKMKNKGQMRLEKVRCRGGGWKQHLGCRKRREV